MNLKKVPPWSDFPMQEINYGFGNNSFGIYRINSWMIWPDIEGGATKKEVRTAIKIWQHHNYAPLTEWLDFIMANKPPSAKE